MKRGDLVTIALSGDFGKPRPALIIQSDQFAETGTVTVLLISSTLVDAPLLRTTIEPTPANGLRARSQIMVDKPQTPSRGKLGGVIGHLEDATMLQVNRALAVFLGLA